MSPTLTQERSLSPISRSTGSPDSAFTLLLEAVNSKTTSVGPSQVLTPPQSPDGSLFKEMRKLSRRCILIHSATYITRIVGLYIELKVGDGYWEKKRYILTTGSRSVLYPLYSPLQDRITNTIKAIKMHILGIVISSGVL